MGGAPTAVIVKIDHPSEVKLQGAGMSLLAVNSNFCLTTIIFHLIIIFIKITIISLDFNISRNFYLDIKFSSLNAFVIPMKYNCLKGGDPSSPRIFLKN